MYLSTLRKQRRRRSTGPLTLALILAVFTALITGCGSDDSSSSAASDKEKESGGAAKPTVLNVGSFSKAVDYAPYLIARKKGWIDQEFAKDGIDVKYTEYDSAPSITEAYGSKRADLVFLAEVPALIVQAADIDVKVPKISAAIPFTLVVRPDSPAKKVGDLKGKKIAVLTGTGSHYGLLKELDNAGLKSSDVQIVNLAPDDAKAAFEAGKVDAWAVWPPYVQQEEVAGKGRIIEGGSSSRIYSVLSVRGDIFDGQPELVERFQGVLDKAIDWLDKNPDEAKQIVAEELGFDNKIIDSSWAINDWGAPITEALVPDFQGRADFLKEGGFVTRKVDVAKEGFVALP